MGQSFRKSDRTTSLFASSECSGEGFAKRSIAIVTCHPVETSFSLILLPFPTSANCHSCQSHNCQHEQLIPYYQLYPTPEARRYSASVKQGWKAYHEYIRRPKPSDHYAHQLLRPKDLHWPRYNRWTRQLQMVGHCV